METHTKNSSFSSTITIHYQGELGASLQITQIDGSDTNLIIPTQGITTEDNTQKAGSINVQVKPIGEKTELSTTLSNGTGFSLYTKSLFEFFSKFGAAEKAI